MRRVLLGWSLLIAGIFCLLQQPMPRAYWQSRAQVAVTASAPNNTAIDCVGGIAACPNNNASAASVILPSFSTTAAGTIVVFIELNAANHVCTVVDTALLSYSQRATNSTQNFQEFFVTSSGAQSGDMVTVSCATATYIEATAFGVKGVNTAVNNGFDTNASLGNGGAVTSGSITVNTSNANDYLYAGFRTATVVPASGFVQIGTGSFLLVEALNPHPTTIQSSLNIPDPGSNSGGIADAVISN